MKPRCRAAPHATASALQQPASDDCGREQQLLRRPSRPTKHTAAVAIAGLAATIRRHSLPTECVAVALHWRSYSALL